MFRSPFYRSSRVAALGLVLLIYTLVGCSSPDPSTDTPETPANGSPSESQPSGRTADSGGSEDQGSSGEETSAEPGRRIFSTAQEALKGGADVSGVFVFYLHGAVVEGSDGRPTHPERGVYEYQEILEAIAATEVVVISEIRPAQTQVEAYAQGIVEQIRALTDAGVHGSRIAVVGFSKGGVIGLHVSGLLDDDRIGYVIMAACGSWLDDLDLELHGRMLSIYEKSDAVGSCRPAVERFDTAGNLFFHEVETEMGGGHGAFFKPQPDWLDQAMLWCDAPGLKAQLVAPEAIHVVKPEPPKI